MEIHFPHPKQPTVKTNQHVFHLPSVMHFFSKYISTVNFSVKSGAWSANLKEIHSLLSTNVALDGIAPLHVETGNDQGGLATGSTKYERIPRSRLYYGLWRLWTLNPVFVGNIWIDIIFLHDIILNSTSHTCN